jgi:hypothetical protein
MPWHIEGVRTGLKALHESSAQVRFFSGPNSGISFMDLENPKSDFSSLMKQTQTSHSQ